MLPSVGRTFTFKNEIFHPHKQKVYLDKLEQEKKHTQSFTLAHGCPESYSRALNRKPLKGFLEHFMPLNSAHEDVLLSFHRESKSSLTENLEDPFWSESRLPTIL